MHIEDNYTRQSVYLILSSGKVTKKKRIKGIKVLEPGLPVFWQAILAIHGSAFGWLKGYFAFFSAVGTGYFCHFTWAGVSGTATAKIR